MPAKPRLASQVFDRALDVASRYPEDADVKELVLLAGDLHYGTELALSHLNRGVSGDNARRLTREYERFKKRLETQP